MNYVDYANHSLHSPTTYHRRYDLDLSQGVEGTVKRAALAALPFIGLYRPAGFAMSIGMNAVRTITHVQNGVRAEKWGGAAVEMGKASLAALSLATTVHHFTVGLFITSGADFIQGTAASFLAVWEGEYSKAGEEALQAMASAAYLAFMATGALEAMAAFTILQAAVSLYQARKEIGEGRYIEAAAKLAMGGIRLHQARGYIEQIQRQRACLQILRIRAVYERILRGRSASHLIHHPLSSLKDRIEAKEVVFSDGKGDEVHFGAHFHGNGGSLVKGENLAFRTKIVNGEEITELDFKINHAFREHLEEAIRQLKNVKESEMQDILAFTGSHADQITVGSGSFFKGSDWLGKTHEIQVHGLGTIRVGASVDEPTLYDRVVVQLKGKRTLYELHEMLSLIDLDRAIRLSTNDDIERLKMGHLFRTFFPREATPFERSEEFFSLSLEGLKAKMIEKSPEMQAVFDTYYHRMKEESLFDGRVRYRIEGLADAAREKGARAMTSAVMGAYGEKELFERVASMLKIGMLATEVRDANDFGHHGLSAGADYKSGGADSVFTQLLTEKNVKDKMNFSELNYWSKIRFIISLDALETGTYQYHNDSFGNRVYNSKGQSWWWSQGLYSTRGSILEFIEREQKSKYVHGGHEVMLKERVDPKYFKAIVVPNEQVKSNLIAYLRERGLVQNESLLNSSIDRFIRVGTQVTEDLIS